MKRPLAAGLLAAASPGGQPAPTIGGFTADQRSSMGWAQVGRLTHPHSPGRRVPAAAGAEAGPRARRAGADPVRA